MSKITVGKYSVPRSTTREWFRLISFAAGVRQQVAELLEYSNETKKRNFLETVEYVHIAIESSRPRGTWANIRKGSRSA